MKQRAQDIILRSELQALHLGVIEREYRFENKRRWRFDFAIPSVMLAAELEGGIWTNGRHNRGKGYQGDLDKYNTATAMGWSVLRFSTEDVLEGRAKLILLAWKNLHDTKGDYAPHTERE